MCLSYCTTALKLKSADINIYTIDIVTIFTGTLLVQIAGILYVSTDKGKGKKDRIVPFPNSFKEILAVHVENSKKNAAKYLFESSWKKNYSDRGVRKILMKYTKEAGIEQSISPHTLRHFLFTWMKKKGVDDALIQPYSGHDSRQSLEMYSKLSLGDCQPEYEKKIKDFPI